MTSEPASTRLTGFAGSKFQPLGVPVKHTAARGMNNAVGSQAPTIKLDDNGASRTKDTEPNNTHNNKSRDRHRSRVAFPMLSVP